MASEIVIDKTTHTFGILNFMGKGSIYVEKGKDFDIVEVLEDIDSGDIYYRVKVKKLGKANEFIIPKTEATDSKLVLKYATKGIDVNSGNASIVPEVFQKKEDEYVEKKYKIGKVHTIIGIKTYEDKKGLIHYTYAGNYCRKLKSTYLGHLDVEPKGDSNIWLNVAREIVNKNIKFGFGIAIAFASMLIAVLEDEDIDNIIFHLVGESSTGKSTLLNFSVSVFGPGVENNPQGLISTWNGTKNALLRRLMRVYGVLMGLDEFSMCNEKNFSGLVYSISSGVEKDRLTRSAEIQERLTGKYIVLSTGEASILSKCNGNIGLSMRVIEFQDVQWTSSSEESEYIKNIVKNNYGYAANEFSDKLDNWIGKNGISALKAEYQAMRDLYCSKSSFQARKERMSSRYGIILLAAKLANELLGFKISVDKLCDFLVENEKRSDDDHENYSSFYEKLVSYISSQKYNHFQVISKSCNKTQISDSKPSEMWGIIKKLDGIKQLDSGEYSDETASIPMNIFDEIVKKLGYEDPKVIRRFLKRKGLTICEQDRDTIRKVMNGVRMQMVEVYLPNMDHKPEIKTPIRDEIDHSLTELAELEDYNTKECYDLTKKLQKLNKYLTEEDFQKIREIEYKANNQKIKDKFCLDDED